MQDIKVTLSIIWIAVMLDFLWGDVLTIFVGDKLAGGFSQMKWTQVTAMAAAVLMVTPILMVVLSLVLPHNVNRLANIIVAAFWFLFNLVGLPTYPGHFEKFLLAVSMVFNLTTVWYAWNWV